MGKVFFDFPASPIFIYISKVYYCDAKSKIFALRIFFRELTRPEFIEVFHQQRLTGGGQMRRSRL